MLSDALRKVGDVEPAELFLPRSGKRVQASFAVGDYLAIGSVVSDSIKMAASEGSLIFRYHDVTWVQDEDLAEMGITGYRIGSEVSRLYLAENIDSSDFLDVGLGLGLFADYDRDVIEQVSSFFDSIRARLQFFAPFSIQKNQMLFDFWDENTGSIRPVIREVFRFNKEVLKFQKPGHEEEDEVPNCAEKGFFWLGDG